MFTRSAELYDALYAWKDYAAEADRLRAMIAEHARRPARTLLDVACGTGAHLAELRGHFEVEGLDLDPGLLDVARRRLPDVPLHQADMTSFDLGRSYDVVACLFSAIGYARTEDRMRTAVARMAAHAAPGGLVAVEPWFGPDDFRPGHLGGLFVDRPDLKIARISVSEVAGRLSAFDFHYLVGRPGGVEHFVERHELGLFTEVEYRRAFGLAGLEPTLYDAEGLEGRGLYIGLQPERA